MKTVHVCAVCGSALIQQDAWVLLNDPENVQIFDDLYCENCEKSCSTNKVEVSDEFDIYTDSYTGEVT